MLQSKMARALMLCAFCVLTFLNVDAQTPAERSGARKPETATPNSGDTKTEMDEVRRQLREQQEELKRMTALINEQTRVIGELRQRVEQSEQRTSSAPAVITTAGVATSDQIARPSQDSSSAATTGKGQQDTEARVARVEEQVKKTSETIARQLGSITFSGDMRLRYESFYGQLNALANGDNPAIVGNPLSTRQRFRVRARLAMRGQIGKEFDWGIRFSTSSFADTISSNQTLTDFFNRKPFGLDNAYLAWTPQRVAGLRLQAGKFEVPWVRTEMTIDNDLNPEGFNEIYSRGFQKSTLKNITFVAWQLPFLERNSAFVRNPNGTVNIDESRRAGRDLALYGAQLRARFEPSEKVGLTLSVADLYYSGAQFISPVQVFGNQLQLPVTINIPATANAPAQTVTTQVSIPRDLLVAGVGNLGVSTASNNAVNRDGRLSSGFNLVDFIGRLDLAYSKRYPLAFIFNFVTNTQTHDVVVAGAGGANVLLPNHENHGYWAELQVGRIKERGDILFGYTFIRIEKDAVLTPFNFSDLIQQSDSRTHRLSFNYTADPRMLLTLTGFIAERPNGLLGAFGNTPLGSLNRPTVRVQFDTTFRF
jgi:hypothetical protein